MTGKAEPKKMLRQVYDLNDVMLSEPLDDNKCGGCGCILNPLKGHPCPPSSQLDSIESHKNLKGPCKSLRRGISNLLHGGKEKNKVPKLECAKKVYTCHFTKKRYCENCHWNDQWYIPPSMIHINDYSKKPVSSIFSFRSQYIFKSVRDIYQNLFLKKCLQDLTS